MRTWPGAKQGGRKSGVIVEVMPDLDVDAMVFATHPSGTDLTA
jgi:hypothetical protein